MRILVLLLALPLAASGLRVVAVERSGWPPYEDDRRTYRLAGEGTAVLRPGDLLRLARPGEVRDLGRLRVVAVEPGRVSARLETRGATYPLIGDQAEPGAVFRMPGFPPTAALPDVRLRPPAVAVPAEPMEKLRTVPAPMPAAPMQATPQPAAPPPATTQPAAPESHRRVESIFFLEGDGSLSPKGRDKLQRAVAAHGAGGRWVLAVPEDRVLPERVSTQRVQALRRALAALGVVQVGVREVPRGEGEPADVVHLERN